MPYVVRRNGMYWRDPPAYDGDWWAYAPADAKVYETKRDALLTCPACDVKHAREPFEIVDQAEALMTYDGGGLEYGPFEVADLDPPALAPGDTLTHHITIKVS